MVSIILPNLNTPQTFLLPRISSIIGQSFTDWECIVIDGFSDNGSWEMIREKTKGDKRFSYYQRPARGIYDAWNEGIKLANGAYIYIATSDDLFSDDFLKEMVGILDTNTDCGMAHCCLTIIDENGNPTPYQWRDWDKVKFYGDYINSYHKRLAPYDAIIHFGWNTVYSSIVQLLIRKEVFEKAGYFSTEYGTIADFEWELRASLCINLVHVPLYLASWRKHNHQATSDDYFSTPEFPQELIRMAANALKKMEEHHIILPHKKGLYFNYLFQQFNLTKRKQKFNFLLKLLGRAPLSAIKIINHRLAYAKFDTEAFLRKQLKQRKIDNLIRG
ncbi:MAG TPA: glycosyltransferase [Mucilaginibacter sp.]